MDPGLFEFFQSFVSGCFDFFKLSIPGTSISFWSVIIIVWLIGAITRGLSLFFGTEQVLGPLFSNLVGKSSGSSVASGRRSEKRYKDMTYSERSQYLERSMRDIVKKRR